jgi:hypothetical protein
MLAHEEKYWLRSAPSGEDELLLRRCVALATLTGAATFVQASSTLTAIPELSDATRSRRDRLARWLSEIYPGEEYWNPLRPDRLGENLVSYCLLNEENQGTIAAVYSKASSAQLERALEVLKRCAGGDEHSRRIVYASLASELPALTSRTEIILRGGEAA